MNVVTSGSETAVISTPSTLAQQSTAGAYSVTVDLSNLAAGATPDIVTISVEIQCASGGSWRRVEGETRTFVGGQVSDPAYQARRIDAAFGWRFVILQSQGTGRAFPWFVTSDQVQLSSGGVTALLGAANTTETAQTTVGGQLRRAHVLSGGTIANKDHSAANPAWTHRNEANSADLITSTHTVAGSVETITPS